MTTFILLPLLLGCIDMGRYMYIGILVGNAARAGAAYGATNPGGGPTGTGIQDAACNDFLNNLSGPTVSCSGYQNTSPPSPPSSGSLSVNSVVVTWYQNCGCDVGGTIGTVYNGAVCDDAGSLSAYTGCSGHWAAMINVQATGSFKPLVGFPGIPNPMLISRTATMRVGQ